MLETIRLCFQLCWVLYCDLMCLDYDGNLRDACVIALLAALKNSKSYSGSVQLLPHTYGEGHVLMPVLRVARLPEAVISTETRLPVVNLEERHALKVCKHPVAASFSVFDE